MQATGADPDDASALDARPDYAVKNLSVEELRRAVVLRELLDPPLALRPFDAARW